MAFSHGKNAYFAVGTSGAETVATDISTYLDDVTVPRSMDSGETTTFGQGARTYLAGLQDGTVSLSGKFDPTVDTIFSNLDGHEIPLAWDYGPVGNTTGDKKISQAGGTGNPGLILQSYEVSSPVGDIVTFSAEFQISDVVTHGVF